MNKSPERKKTETQRGLKKKYRKKNAMQKHAE